MTSHVRSAAYAGEYRCDICGDETIVPIEKPTDPRESIHGPVLDGWARIEWVAHPHGNRPRRIADVCSACLRLPFSEIIGKVKDDG